MGYHKLNAPTCATKKKDASMFNLAVQTMDYIVVLPASGPVGFKRDRYVKTRRRGALNDIITEVPPIK